jgi:hypothetical protein
VYAGAFISCTPRDDGIHVEVVYGVPDVAVTEPAHVLLVVDAVPADAHAVLLTVPAGGLVLAGAGYGKFTLDAT